MTPPEQINRRKFINQSSKIAVVAAGATFAASTTSATKPTFAKSTSTAKKTETKTETKVGAFTKSFQDHSIPEVCHIFKKIGLDGLDLTVRKGGHIDPKNVKTELPQAAAAAKAEGVELLFLTTGITENNQEAEALLAAAEKIGIDRIKLGYFRYKQFGTLAKQIGMVKKSLARIIKLTKKYHIKPCVHIHSNSLIPSHGTLCYQLLQDFDPKEIGAYVDTLHMVKEGAGDGWRQGLDLLAPWVSMCAVKNFSFEQDKNNKRDKQGQMIWHTKTVPVADGISPIPKFVMRLKQIGFHGPYSLHSEYKGRHSFVNMNTEACIAQTEKDIKYFRPLVN